MEQEIINQTIGSLIVKEKYKFIPDGLVGEIIRDFVKEYEENVKSN